VGALSLAGGKTTDENAFSARPHDRQLRKSKPAFKSHHINIVNSLDFDQLSAINDFHGSTERDTKGREMGGNPDKETTN